MDFMKIIKSLEQLLYELMVWLVFYPLTLWRSLVHPLRLMDYADDELEDAEDDRYSDTLSPPIFLAISLGLIHLIELAKQWNLATEGLLADDTNLLAFRLVAFSLFPLLMSLRMLRAKGVALDRKTLRLPFYAQCFIAAPFAIGIDAGTLLIAAGAGPLMGFGALALTTIWYLTVQTMWFRAGLGGSWMRAVGNALRGFVGALVIVAILGAIIDML